MDDIIEKANKVYRDNFNGETWFERAIFFSWYCAYSDCKFCYMSTQKEHIKNPEKARRSISSLEAEAIICRMQGWKIGFLAGGYRAYELKGFKDMVGKISKAYKDKIWLNVGDLKKEEIEDLKEYVEGVCAAIEVPNPELRKKICPSKKIEPLLNMLEDAKTLGIKRSITIILGLGETIEDFSFVDNIINRYDVEKIVYYALNPHKGTEFEKVKAPGIDYISLWVAKTRIAFPKLKIVAGVWKDKAEYAEKLLYAGANAITKFPAIERFGTKEAKIIENSAKACNRKFIGSMTKLKIEGIGAIEDIEVENKLDTYVKSMKQFLV